MFFLALLCSFGNNSITIPHMIIIRKKYLYRSYYLKIGYSDGKDLSVYLINKLVFGWQICGTLKILLYFYRLQCKLEVII